MDVVGIGNALMDVIAFVDEDFAPSLGFHNNSTVHLERSRLELVLEALDRPYLTAGGGAANMAKTAATLGLASAFVGALGQDRYGDLYRADFEAARVCSRFSISDESTGVYCALIKPDGGRTLLVAPGAAGYVTRQAPPADLFSKEAILYIEGFLLRDRRFFLSTLETARSAGMRIAIDLGSQSLVQASRGFILDLLPDYCDYLFANEDELEALSELPLGEGLALLGEGETAVIVKLAERGAIYARKGERVESPVRAVRPVDETGAGDAFAAGFLSGLARSFPPERCLRLGNRIAEEVLLVPGLSVDPERIRRARSSVAA